MFRSPEGVRLGTANAILLGVFDALIAVAPTAIQLDDLVNDVRDRLAASAPRHPRACRRSVFFF